MADNDTVTLKKEIVDMEDGRKLYKYEFVLEPQEPDTKPVPAPAN